MRASQARKITESYTTTKEDEYNRTLDKIQVYASAGMSKLYTYADQEFVDFIVNKLVELGYNVHFERVTGTDFRIEIEW